MEGGARTDRDGGERNAKKEQREAEDANRNGRLCVEVCVLMRAQG